MFVSTKIFTILTKVRLKQMVSNECNDVLKSVLQTQKETALFL